MVWPVYIRPQRLPICLSLSSPSPLTLSVISYTEANHTQTKHPLEREREINISLSLSTFWRFSPVKKESSFVSGIISLDFPLLGSFQANPSLLSSLRFQFSDSIFVLDSVLSKVAIFMRTLIPVSCEMKALSFIVIASLVEEDSFMHTIFSWVWTVSGTQSCEDLYLKEERTNMPRWICCGGHRSGDSDISNDEKHLKTQWQQPDGM